MTVDKTKLKTLNKLNDEGFDSEKKISTIDMKVAFEHGLNNEIGVILELQDAIKDRKVISYLCNAVEEEKKKEHKKEERRYGGEHSNGFGNHQ